MKERVKQINDTNASFRTLTAGDAQNTDLFLIMLTMNYSKMKEKLSRLGFQRRILPKRYYLYLLSYLGSMTHPLSMNKSIFLFRLFINNSQC